MSELETGTPSITYNGWVEPLREPIPRINTFWSAPGSPVEAPMLTPAILPSNDLMSEDLAADMSLSFITAAEPVKEALVVVP